MKSLDKMKIYNYIELDVESATRRKHEYKLKLSQSFNDLKRFAFSETTIK